MDEKLSKHKFVIIGADNLNTLGVLRSLSEAGISPYIILSTDIGSNFVRNSKWAKNIIFSPSIKENYEILVSKFGGQENKPFVFTTDDANEQMLDENYDELKDCFFFYNAGKQGQVSKYMSKDAQCDLAQEIGLKTAPYEVVNLGELPQKIDYPIITKTLNPNMPGWKKDVFICYNENELKEAYTTMISPKLLLQEYIEKKNEMPIHGFSCNNGQSVFLAYYSLYYRMEKDNFGFYNYYKPMRDSKLYELIKKMIGTIGYSGCFEVEFLVDNKDELDFLEINLRSSMRMYACTYGGINLPFLWAKSMLENNIDFDSIQPKKEFFSAMYEPADYAQYVATKKLGYMRWLNDLRKADLKFLYNKNDKRPAFKYWTKAIRNMVKYKLKFGRKND